MMSHRITTPPPLLLLLIGLLWWAPAAARAHELEEADGVEAEEEPRPPGRTAAISAVPLIRGATGLGTFSLSVGAMVVGEVFLTPEHALVLDLRLAWTETRYREMLDARTSLGWRKYWRKKGDGGFFELQGGALGRHNDPLSGRPHEVALLATATLGYRWFWPDSGLIFTLRAGPGGSLTVYHPETPRKRPELTGPYLDSEISLGFAF